MNSLIKKQAEKLVYKKKIFKKWLAVVLCLALIVTMGTFVALTKNGRALDHTHTEDCYDEAGNLVCEESELEGEAADADAAGGTATADGTDAAGGTATADGTDAAGGTATADGTDAAGDTAFADGTDAAGGTGAGAADETGAADGTAMADGTGAAEGTDAAGDTAFADGTNVAGGTGTEATDETGAADGTDAAGDTAFADGAGAADGEEAAAAGTDETGGADDTHADGTDADESDGAAAENAYDVASALTYEDDEITVNVSAATADAIPADATLRVTPILKDAGETAEQYAAVEAQLLEKASTEEYEIAGFLAYDITLLDKDGNEIEPDGDVKVSFEYKEAAIPEGAADVISGALEDAAVDAAADEGAAEAAGGNAADTTEAADTATTDITVFHLEEDETGAVADVVDLGAEDGYQIETLETTENQEVEKVEFVTDSFSVYTITWQVSSNDSTVLGTVKLIELAVDYNENGTATISKIDKTGSDGGQITLYNQNNIDIKEAINAEKLANQTVTIDNTTYTYTGAMLDPSEGKTETEAGSTGYTYDDLIKSGVEIKKISYNENDGSGCVWHYTVEDNTNSWAHIINKDDWSSNKGKGEIYVYLIYEQDSDKAKTKVDTVTCANLTMKMANWSSKEFSGGEYESNSQLQPIITQNLLERTISNGAFYPDYGDSISSSVANTFAGLFNNAETVGSQLFIKDVYESDAKKGYYYFDSSEYGAYLEETEYGTDFAVYEELVSPRANAADMKSGTNMHGAFFPYNTITKSILNKLPSKSAGKYSLLDSEYADIYYPDQADDDYFGMELSGNFSQPVDGIDDYKHPVVYEFKGDDDLWVYIDGVLVLDLGGLHDTAAGKIDFSTGKVYIQAGRIDNQPTDADGASIFRTSTESGYNYETTLYELFQAEKKENSIKWQTNNDNYIFADYTTHTFQMWYLERGAYNSNLKVEFNLPFVDEKNVTIGKELENVNAAIDTDEKFGFRLMAQKPNGDGTFDNDSYVPVTDNAEYVGKEGEVSIDKTTGIFYLKPGEQVTFSQIPVNRAYYVEEIGFDTGKYDEVKVNGEKVAISGCTFNENGTLTVEGTTSEDEGTGDGSEEYQSYAKSGIFTGKENQTVIFTNKASSQALRITKKLGVYGLAASPESGAGSDGTGDTTGTGSETAGEGEETDEDGNGINLTSVDRYSFVVYFENNGGGLSGYTGEYYLVDQDGNYYTYEKDSDGKSILTKKGEEKVVCGKAVEGKISGIPAYYTVIIPQILPGTAFKVEEDLGELDPDYWPYEMELEEDTYDEFDGGEDRSDGANGKIKSGCDAKITVTNYPKRELKVTKVWQGDALEAGNQPGIYVGLYKNGTPVRNAYIELTSDNDYQGSFDSKYLYEPVGYTVKELKKIEGTDTDEVPEFFIGDDGYVGIDDGEMFTISGTEYQVLYTDSTIVGNVQTETIVNAPVWTIQKISSTQVTGDGGESSIEVLPLTGAIFKLTQKTETSPTTEAETENTDGTSNSEEVEATGTAYFGKSEDNGMVTWYKANPSENESADPISYLPDGIYTLEEIQAPTGYGLSTVTWTIEIKDGYAESVKTADGTDVAQAAGDGGSIHYVYRYTDEALYSLPEAGGPGIYIYTIAGVMLMMAGAFILYRRRVTW